MFDTTKEDLKDNSNEKLMKEGCNSPTFSADYVWGDEDVRSLIASIAKGFPIGALLTLETGGEVKFKPRLLAGVRHNGTDPSELLLDGQQRMTSLFQAMFAKDPVRTRTPRGTMVERFYYLDIKKNGREFCELEEQSLVCQATR
jgi:uncharacterized protein with ParB-like and HNH nuclease domain